MSTCFFFILRFPEISPSCVDIFIFSPWQVPLTNLLFTDLLLSACHEIKNALISEIITLPRAELLFLSFSDRPVSDVCFSHPQILRFHTHGHTHTHYESCEYTGHLCSSRAPSIGASLPLHPAQCSPLGSCCCAWCVWSGVPTVLYTFLHLKVSTDHLIKSVQCAHAPNTYRHLKDTTVGLKRVGSLFPESSVPQRELPFLMVVIF